MGVRSFTIPTTDAAVGPPVGIYQGHSTLRETGGAAVIAELRDGSATGQLIEVIALTANGTQVAQAQTPAGVVTAKGVFLHIVSGTGLIEGAAYIS